MELPGILLPFLVAVSTWLTASPQHAEGLLVYYGSDRLARSNAEYRGYDITLYKDNCGLSVISPSDLGKIVWVKIYTGESYYWYGPCLGVDVAARRDFHRIVYRNQEVAEISRTLRDKLNFTHGKWGEIYIGLCPPLPGQSIPRRYIPPLHFDYSGEMRNPYIRWPKQQSPASCDWETRMIMGSQYTR